MPENQIHNQTILACIWDFDKTLIPGYMQTPLFDAYGVDEKKFWKEVEALPARYAERGCLVSKDTVYLNHLLSYVRSGLCKGLNNARLREFGKDLLFYPGLPDLFRELKKIVRSNAEFIKHDVRLEHYIISTGLAEIIRGSEIAPHVDGIFGCEFIEDPLPPGFLHQGEFEMEVEPEISQIGVMVDNTIKTRFIFEINKGTNRNPEIDVNASIATSDRRIPLDNMIYIADGPSDVPVFSVVRSGGGRTFAVYDPESPEEFAQNDALLQTGRIHSYGPADYRDQSSTALWLKMHVLRIAERLVQRRKEELASRVSGPPRHLHKPEPLPDAKDPLQQNLFE